MTDRTKADLLRKQARRFEVATYAGDRGPDTELLEALLAGADALDQRDALENIYPGETENVQLDDPRLLRFMHDVDGIRKVLRPSEVSALALRLQRERDAALTEASSAKAQAERIFDVLTTKEETIRNYEADLPKYGAEMERLAKERDEQISRINGFRAWVKSRNPGGLTKTEILERLDGRQSEVES